MLSDKFLNVWKTKGKKIDQKRLLIDSKIKRLMVSAIVIKMMNDT